MYPRHAKAAARLIPAIELATADVKTLSEVHGINREAVLEIELRSRAASAICG